MTDLARIGASIKMMEQKLIEAERYYHHALRFGSYSEIMAALDDCRFIRADLIRLVKHRDDMIGGGSDASA